MKKFISNVIIAILSLLVFFIIILSTLGIETNKINNLVSQKINRSNNNINLELNTIKFKLDIKEISLFLETSNPQINYREVSIPTKNIKVYVDFLSLITSTPKINKINLVLKEIDIIQLKRIITTIKPSNFKSFVNNKIKQGKLTSELEFYLDENNKLKNYIAKGAVKDLKIEVLENLILEKTNLSFFADKEDILIKNIFGEIDSIKIKDGDLKLKLIPEISLQSNFQTNLDYSEKSFIKFSNLFKNIQHVEDLISLKADLNNNLLINFDKTYKVKNYSFNSGVKISKDNLKFKKPIKYDFFAQDLNKLSLIDSEIKTNFNSKENITNISGKYSINNEDFLKYNLDNNINKNVLSLKLDLEFNQQINLELINYKKLKNTIAKFSINLKKKKDNIKIENLTLSEKNNSISIEDLQFNKNKFLSFKKILVKTYQKGKKNNDFSIVYGKKIRIKGSQFDASNLSKIISKKSKQNNFLKVNNEIEIDFKNIAAPLSENLKNFKLIGLIEKGKFTKISSKGDFGNNNFLDISMRSDKKNKKKYLEIYSDLPQPLLTEYSFFKGLTNGKLLFTSTIYDNKLKSKLKIENFKMISAPGMVKLLSLADLGGLADLAEGEGLSFDILEISIENDNGFLKFGEILATGPSVSVLMEGYQDQNGLTSLKGTLVPAKNLNKLISKIPVLGDIIIPKEAGEGLFGISFKMKGPPGKIKTTINPIKTITPRFIQKILEKKSK
jgi:hypothetical protein